MSETTIKKVEGKGTFEDVLSEASPEVQEIARTARRIIAEVMPGVTEVSWARQKIAGYGVGPKKMSEHFCYIAVFKNRINLGFFYGADLDDPENLLDGSGQLMRHIKIPDLETLQKPAVRNLIEQAKIHLPKLT